MSLSQRVQSGLRHLKEVVVEDSVAPAGGATSENRDTAAAVTKWLIPSVSALFIAIGYVAIEAQQNLLGIKLDGIGPTEYIVATAGFLRDICTILPDTTFRYFSYIVVNWPQLVLTIAIVSTCLFIIVKDKLSRKNGKYYRTKKVTFLLLLFIWVKFISMDAPLTRIEDAVVDSGTKEGGVPIEIRLSEKAKDKSKLLKLQIYKRANNIWKDIIESRTGNIDAGEIAKFRVESEFVSHSFICILLFLLSILILKRSSSATVSVFSILSLFYILTWPYAYGKLVKSTFFEYGEIFTKSQLTDLELAQSGEEKSMHGMVLAHDSKSYKVLYLKKLPTACGGAGATKIKFLELPDSDVTAIKEIYWQDVLLWRATNQKDCPTAKEVMQ